MVRCRCGNILETDDQDGRGYTYMPPRCQCASPGPGTVKRIVPPFIPEIQRREREALGLPVLTDIERGVGRNRPRWE